MKIRLKEAFIYAKRLAAFKDKVFPAKLSFAIYCNEETLQKEIERSEKERTKLCEQYAEKDEEGKPVMTDNIVNGKKVQAYKLSDENQAIFAEEYNELLETEVEIDIRKAKTSILEKCETYDRYSVLSVAEISALSFMLEE